MTQTAVITGASRGIGRELALLLASHGTNVVLTGRSEKDLKDTAGRAAAHGMGVQWLAGDVADPEDCAKTIARTIESFGQLDVLFNNAGISMRGSVEELSPEVTRQVVDTNLRGAINMTVAALPHLRKGRGSVIFTSTLAALYGFPGVSIYAASKMGLTAFAQSVRAEYGAEGVHAGVVYLGFTDNDPDKTILSARGESFSHKRSSQLSQPRAATILERTWQKRRNRDLTVGSGYALDFAVRAFPRLTGAFLARSGGRIHRVGTQGDSPKD